MPQTPIAVRNNMVTIQRFFFLMLVMQTYKPSLSMISIVMMDADELFGGLMISSFPPIISKPSAKSSFMTGILIIVVSLPVIDINFDICL